MESNAPRKLGFGPLALMEWLCAAPAGERMFSRGGGPDNSHLWLFEAGPAGEDGRRPLRRIIPGDRDGEGAAMLAALGGRAAFDTHALTREGFEHRQHASGHLSQAGAAAWDDFSARYDAKWFRYTDSVSIPGPGAYAYWQAHGRGQLAALRALREERLREADRPVLVRAPWQPDPAMPDDLARIAPPRFRMPAVERGFDRPYATARVTKVTPRRVYVTGVERLSAPGEGRFLREPLNRAADGLWVSPGDVWLDPCDPAAVESLRAACDAYAEGACEAVLAAMHVVVPAMKDLALALAQRAARREDEVREALAATAPAPVGGEGDGHPVEAPAHARGPM